MGNTASALDSLTNVFGGKRSVKLLMVGLDAAGKTTVLYKLKLGDLITPVPTVGFNVETAEYKNLKFTVRDIGVQDRGLRPLWRRYFNETDGIIFVVDSNDRDRLDLARAELENLTTDDALADATLLVLANKQDLPRAVTPAELTDKLGLRSLKRDWHIQGTCAPTGEGLCEGLDWMASSIAGPGSGDA